MDINLDLAAVQSRIAEIAGGDMALPFAQNASFASALDAASATAPAAAAQGALQWPVAGRISSPFGERKNPLGPGEDFHPGIDIAADAGAPIASAAAGRVVSAGPDGGYGNTVVIDDGGGMTTRYAHCSQILARVGQSVAAGETIATVGSTGASTGPHLHFEVRIGGQPVDPSQFLSR